MSDPKAPSSTEPTDDIDELYARRDGPDAARRQAPGAASSVMYTGLSQGYRAFLTFFSGIILARLLTPQDFGLVAMVWPVVALSSLIQDLGLNQATIQREKITGAQVSGLFWIGAGVSAALAMVLWSLSPVVADFYSDPRITALVCAFAMLAFIWSLQSQPHALLSRRMQFKQLAVIETAAATAGFIVAVTCAYVWQTYWALFAGMAATSAVGCTATWLASGFRPRLPRFERSHMDLLGFGSSVSGFNILNFFARNLDNVLIGRFHGASELGLYDRAYKLLLLPLEQVTHPLGRVMLPYLSRNQSNEPVYRQMYERAATALMAITQPGILVLTVFAEDAFRILFGPAWLGAAPIFQCLGAAALLQVVTSSLGWLFLSQGRGLHYLTVGAVGSAITITAIITGLQWGALGVAFAYAVGDLALKGPFTIWMAGRAGPVRFGHLCALIGPHLAAIAIAAAAIVPLKLAVGEAGILVCLAAAALSYVVYASALAAFPGKRATLAEFIKKAVVAYSNWAHPPADGVARPPG